MTWFWCDLLKKTDWYVETWGYEKKTKQLKILCVFDKRKIPTIELKVMLSTKVFSCRITGYIFMMEVKLLRRYEV